jgi:hypothetical protein
MAVERGIKAKLRYRWDEFLSGGAGRQLLLLFVLTMLVVVVFTAISLPISGVGPEESTEHHATVLDKAWFYFTRMLDAGTMGDDAGELNRFVSTGATILGVIVAGLLISSLAGNFQERLEAIRRGGSPVMEEGHFLVLGWSEKIPSVLDQISEAYEGQKIVAVILGDEDKADMEEKVRSKVTYPERMKIVVRSGSSLDIDDLARVSFDKARAIVVLVNDSDTSDPNKADGRIIKTLLALFNHPDAQGKTNDLRVTAEVMLAANQDIAAIASGGRAHVIKTNEIISKILLQTSRSSGLSLVYDELLRFEGNEFHIKQFPVAGRRFGELVLSFANGLLIGIAKTDGSGHVLNPPDDRVVQSDEALIVLCEDSNIQFVDRGAPPKVTVPSTPATKPVEHMLVLGWNAKIFPILAEFDNYVGPGSSITLLNTVPEEERQRQLAQKLPALKNVTVRHMTGEFTSRALMERVQPQRYPTVMVLGDAAGEGSVEESDTRAIIALLLLRDFRQKAGIAEQKVCSEILDPKNRDLAATTEIRDVVISNVMVSMVLAQVTYDPRIRAVLEDVFQSEGSEVYIKDLSLYGSPGQPTTFEHLVVAARARGETAMGIQIFENDASKCYGFALNPVGTARTASFVPKPKDRLIVLAEDDG